MKMHKSSALAGLILLAGIGGAAAQDVIIQPQQETVIREYVQKQRLPPKILAVAPVQMFTALPIRACARISQLRLSQN